MKNLNYLAQPEQIQEKWFKTNAPIGVLLGYPDCCIKEFCNQPPELLKISKPRKEDIIRYKAGCINGKFTGFVPCTHHAKKIIAGEISLQSLINNRNNLMLPFPFA